MTGLELGLVIGTAINGAVSLGAAIVSACTCIRYKDQSSADKEKNAGAKMDNDAYSVTERLADGSYRKEVWKSQHVEVHHENTQHQETEVKFSIPVENKAANTAADAGAAGLTVFNGALSGNPTAIQGLIPSNIIPQQTPEEELEAPQALAGAVIQGFTTMHGNHEETRRMQIQNEQQHAPQNSPQDPPQPKRGKEREKEREEKQEDTAGVEVEDVPDALILHHNQQRTEDSANNNDQRGESSGSGSSSSSTGNAANNNDPAFPLSNANDLTNPSDNNTPVLGHTPEDSSDHL